MSSLSIKHACIDQYGTGMETCYWFCVALWRIREDLRPSGDMIVPSSSVAFFPLFFFLGGVVGGVEEECSSGSESGTEVAFSRLAFISGEFLSIFLLT